MKTKKIIRILDPAPLRNMGSALKAKMFVRCRIICDTFTAPSHYSLLSVCLDFLELAVLDIAAGLLYYIHRQTLPNYEWCAIRLRIMYSALLLLSVLFEFAPFFCIYFGYVALHAIYSMIVVLRHFSIHIIFLFHIVCISNFLYMNFIPLAFT